VEKFEQQGKTMNIWYKICLGIVGTYKTLFIRKVEVVGKDNIPPGPKIFIANHPRISDSFVLPFIVREKLYFLIQADSFTLPILGRLLALAGQIPVTLGQGREALNVAIERLAEGGSVVIYPEGRLNPARDLRRAGAGASILALESGAPVVPLGFYVPEEYSRVFKGHLHGRVNYGYFQIGGPCIVNIGQPWKPLIDEFDQSYRALREVTQQMMNQVMDLVEQAKAEASKYGY
jgi:1-acyl-sn-glycerol-3-phosphate acyltransferase